MAITAATVSRVVGSANESDVNITQHMNPTQEVENADEDAGEDLVIHYAADGEPWLWEIEHASRHPEHIAAALAALRAARGFKDAA